MRKPSTSLLTLSLLSLGLLACDNAPEPTEVRSRLASDLGNVLGETAAATNGTTLAGGTALGFMERALGQSASTSTLRLSNLTSRVTGMFSRSRPSTTSSSFTDEETDAIVEQLNTTIFTDANHLGDGVYAVPVDLACSEPTFDDLGNETGTIIDPECAASWNKIQLRIRVEEDDDALIFAIQVGSGHDEPLQFTLTHNSLAVSVDLDEAEAATETLASAFGETAPNARLAGRVTGKLTVLGTAWVNAAFTIDRSLDIAVADDGLDLDGADAFRLTSAATKVASVELNGNGGHGTFELGLKATTVHTPGIDSMDLDLPGMSVTATAQNGQPLELTNISLGDRTTTMSKNGVQAMAIDLNPDDGRTLSATITSDAAAGTETLSVSPKLDARISINHAALGEPAPFYDVTRVLLTGSVRGGDGSDQLEVLSGGFSITTNPSQYGFSATAGQCVTGEDTYDATTGDYYTAWSVGACL